MNSLALDRHDCLYVISDLHMGGSTGFQIMNRGTRLGRFIDKIAQESPEARVGLVINGDAIDTLAEDFDGYISVHDVDRIVRTHRPRQCVRACVAGARRFRATAAA